MTARRTTPRPSFVASGLTALGVCSLALLGPAPARAQDPTGAPARGGELIGDEGAGSGGPLPFNTCKKTPLPAECVNYVQLSDSFRNVAVINGPVGCDNPFTQQWYRFTGAAGTRMPNTAPPTYACGTHAPGWLNGSNPTVQEGAVARTVCFNWSGNTCNWSEPAQVRNCGDFYVYYLKNVSWGCNGRYCGTN